MKIESKMVFVICHFLILKAWKKLSYATNIAMKHQIMDGVTNMILRIFDIERFEKWPQTSWNNVSSIIAINLLWITSSGVSLAFDVMLENQIFFLNS